MFYDKLSARRYDIRDSSLYDTFEYFVYRTGLFLIDNDFPKLTSKQLSSPLNSRISKVRYPGLATDPYHARAKSFMKGFGAMISFEVKATVAQIDLMCDSSKLITNATSLGGVESIWERRRRWATESQTIPENLIRFSVGIENADDLWADIESAFAAAKIS